LIKIRKKQHTEAKGEKSLSHGVKTANDAGAKKLNPPSTTSEGGERNKNHQQKTGKRTPHQE